MNKKEDTLMTFTIIFFQTFAWKLDGDGVVVKHQDQLFLHLWNNGASGIGAESRSKGKAVLPENQTDQTDPTTPKSGE